MKQYGLIGFPLSHSFSKRYFEEKFAREAITGCRYDLFPLQQITELPALLNAHPQLSGLNVTVPYKEAILPYLQALDTTARQIGAVNCIKVDAGALTGYNTDAFGFHHSLVNFLPHTPRQVFVLGTGGSSKAVTYILQQLQLPYLRVSRTPQSAEISYATIAQHLQDSNLFINTTPLGMFPAVEGCPAIPYHLLSDKDALYDLVYNPAETLFLQKGKQQGCAVKNGLEMLQLQAEESWRIWTAV